MYILIAKITNEVLVISETLERTEDNIIVNEGLLAVPEKFVKKVLKLEEIPEGLEINKYCYTDAKGFYLNPNYKEINAIEPETEEE